MAAGRLYNFNCSVVVPTLNAAKDWPRFAPALIANISPENVLIVDSASTDGTPQLAREAGFQLLQIERKDFNHGGTRQLAADHLADADVLVYLTQDAILAGPNAIGALLSAFENPRTAAVFGRQLPRPGAGPIEAHARLFNYPAISSIRSLENREQLGLKTVFFSNSFGAYRRAALQAVRGFPDNVIFGEDTVIVARLLLHGWDVAYLAEAEAYHSHEYTAIEEFKRYFDIGVLHSREEWMLNTFGKTAGEGRRFVMSEFAHLWPTHLLHVPSAAARTVLKLLGYHAGRMEASLSSGLKRRLSMHRFFWTEFDEA
jgi:rhamnosyltransferase